MLGNAIMNRETLFKLIRFLSGLVGEGYLLLNKIFNRDFA